MGSMSRRVVVALVGVLASVAGVLPSAAVAAAAPPTPWVELGVPAGTAVSGPPAMNARGDMAGAVIEPDDTVAFQWWQTPLLWRADDRDPVPLGPRLPLWDEAFGPVDINDHGVVALSSAASDGYLWRGGERTDLTNPTWIAAPAALNDRGQVAGSLFTPIDPDGPEQVFKAFLWQGGRFAVLPAPAGWNSTAVDINDRGEVLGKLWSGADVRGVLWRYGVMIDLGGRQTDPRDLNERGQVIGDSVFAEGAPSHPFLWRDGVMTDLLAGSGSDTGWAQALNDAGQIVGSVDSRPAVWRNGSLLRITVPGGYGEAIAINERGEVAGTTRDPTLEGGGGEAFTWRGGRTTVLGQPADIYLGNGGPRVVGIDRRGRVAIVYQRLDGRSGLARTGAPVPD